MSKRVLSLFSGIGLLDLGLAWAGFRTVGLCEIEPYCRWVLEQHWPGVPIWSDVREVTGDAVRDWCGAVDVVAGGFPCQPHSVAGSRKGREDERHLWPEFARVIREVRPTWVLAENVPGLRTTAADEVLADLDAAGYSCWPLVVGADDVGAPHRRKRVWIVARLEDADIRRGWTQDRNAGDQGRRASAGGAPVPERGRASVGDAGLAGVDRGKALAHQQGERREGAGPLLDAARSDRWLDPTLARGWPARPGEQQRGWEAPRLADRSSARRCGASRQGDAGTGRQIGGSDQGRGPDRDDAGSPEPGMGRSVDGGARWLARQRSAARRARLKALGNGVVPQVVAEVGRAILAAEASIA